MKICIIGTGYVGLVTGAGLAEFGMEVLCVDKDKKKISALKKGIIPFYEPGLEDLVAKNCSEGRLNFSTNIAKGIDWAKVIFIAVGTPPNTDGSPDLSQVEAAIKEIVRHMKEHRIIVLKSTVPVGTARWVEELMKKELKEDITFDVVSNPEFLREGAAVHDFLHPDRVVIGARNPEAIEIMKEIYSALYLIETPFIITTPETAELIKYASNAFLATKISFINEIANLCEKVGADVHHVAKAMGLDGRIGRKFLHPGPGFGGSCLPKDTKGLVHIGKTYGYELEIVKATIKVNERQRLRMVKKIEQMVGKLNKKVIGILGLSFKPNTDDMREAPSIDIIKALLKKGAKIKAFDPAAIKNAKKIFPEITYCSDAYEVAKGSDAIVLITEWNQFRRLDLERIKKLLRKPIFVDLRNVYEPDEMKNLGFKYCGVGR